jgi:hypothetical protein
LAHALGGCSDAFKPAQLTQSISSMASDRWSLTQSNGGTRTYLLVAAEEPYEAAAALSRLSAPPDLCVRSPSWQAHFTADVVFHGRYVRMIDEPLLARRRSGESEGDYAWRCADALRRLYALDVKKAFVIFDTYVDAVRRPLLLDERALLGLAETVDRDMSTEGNRRSSKRAPDQRAGKQP